MKDFDEMRNIDLDYEPRIVYRKKGGFFGKFVALLMGIILGVVFCLGGIVGLGWYGYTKMPIQNGVNTAQGIAGIEIDYTQYIDGSYGEKTLQNLVGDVIDATQKINNGEGSLNTLNAISPLVGKLVIGDGTEENRGLVGTLGEYAITVDPTEVMNRILVKPEGTPDAPENKDVYFGDYIKYCFDNAPLGDMLQAFGYELNDIIKTICYGVEGVDYVIDENGEMQMLHGATKLTVAEFLSEDLDEKVQILPIDSFVPISFPTDAVMCMLAYGAEYRYEKELDENGNIVMKQVFYEASETPFTLKDDEGNDVTENIVSGAEDAQNGIVLTHKYTKNDTEITETRYLQYNTEDGKYYAFEDAAYTLPIRFKENTIGMLNDGTDALINKMYLKDFLKPTPSTHRAMLAICYGTEGEDWEYDAEGNIQMKGEAKPRTVKDLKEGNLFNTLTLKDLLGEEVNENAILSNLASYSLDELPQEMEKLTFDDVFAEKIYEEDGVTVKPMWQYLFDDPTTNEMETPDQYCLLGETMGVDQMIANMQENMQTATLEKLINDDLVVFEDDPTTPNDESVDEKNAFLASTATIDGTPDGKLVKQMTIIEMINWVMDASGA